MWILKGLLMTVFVIAVPVLIGMPIASLAKLYQDRRVYCLFFAYVIGTMYLFALFEFVAFPMIMLKTTLTSLATLYVLLVLFSLWILNYLAERKMQWKGDVYTKDFFHRMRLGFKSIRKYLWIPLLVAILIFVFIEYHYLFKMHIDDDDANRIGAAVTAWNTDTMYTYNEVTGAYSGFSFNKDILSPWPMIYAVLGKIVHANPTIIAHTAMAPVFLATAFMVYFLMADLLFKGNKTKEIWFMMFLGMLLISFSGNRNSQGVFTITRIWQGKAYVAAVLIPLELYLYLLLARAEENRTKYYILFFIVNAAAVLMSGNGLFDAVFLNLIFVGYDILTKRKWKELGYAALSISAPVFYGALLVISKLR